jgi:hypothetical protein
VNTFNDLNQIKISVTHTITTFFFSFFEKKKKKRPRTAASKSNIKIKGMFFVIILNRKIRGTVLLLEIIFDRDCDLLLKFK